MSIFPTRGPALVVSVKLAAGGEGVAEMIKAVGREPASRHRSGSAVELVFAAATPAEAKAWSALLPAGAEFRIF